MRGLLTAKPFWLSSVSSLLVSAGILDLGVDVLTVIDEFADWSTHCRWSGMCTFTRELCNRIDYHKHHTHDIIQQADLDAWMSLNNHDDWITPFARCQHAKKQFSNVCKLILIMQNSKYHERNKDTTVIMNTVVFVSESEYVIIGQGSKTSEIMNKEDMNPPHFHIVRKIPDCYFEWRLGHTLGGFQNSLDKNWILWNYRIEGSMDEMTAMMNIEDDRPWVIDWPGRVIAVMNGDFIASVSQNKNNDDNRNPSLLLHHLINTDDDNNAVFKDGSHLVRALVDQIEENNGHPSLVHFQHGKGLYILAFALHTRTLSTTIAKMNCRSKHTVIRPFHHPKETTEYQCFKMDSGMVIALCEQDSSENRACLKMIDPHSGLPVSDYPLISGVIEGYISPEKDYALVQTEMGEDHPRWLLYGLKDHSVSIVNCQQHSAEFVDWFTDDKFAMKWHNHDDCVVNLFSVHRPHTQLARLPPMFATAKSIGIQSDRVVCYDGSHINIVQWTDHDLKCEQTQPMTAIEVHMEPDSKKSPRKSSKFACLSSLFRKRGSD